MLSFLSCMKGGLGKGFGLKILFPSIVVLGVQFQCQLHPFCPDTDIWKLCRFLGNMLRALTRLPGGLGWLIPGRIGANRGRLRHVGWEKCFHGLTCRPRESSGEGCLCDLLSLLGYPHGSGGALLDGTLKLRYHTLPFARRLSRLLRIIMGMHIFRRFIVQVVLWVRVLFVKVSKGSDLLRKPDALWFTEFLRILLGLGGELPGGCRGYPALEAGWIGK